jgi:lysophospholipase
MEYLGSDFAAGILVDDTKCVRGFDNAGFAMGTLSSLFNQFLLQVNNTAIPTWLKDDVISVLTDVGEANADIALYLPNPFFHFRNGSNENAFSKTLFLVDGGEDLENIPLAPLIQPLRNVDVIFAIDSSADTSTYWPNGTSMVATYQRSLSSIQNGTTFPSIPDVNTFLNLGLNRRPTFFGCNSSNMTGSGPLIVYLPNSPYSYHSNVSTFKLTYNDTERNMIVLNGYNVATMGNGTVDLVWPTCAGCAILSRSLERTSTDVPEICQECFSKFCWDGTVNSTTPGLYLPPMAVVVESKARKLVRTAIGLALSVLMATQVVLLIC